MGGGGGGRTIENPHRDNEGFAVLLSNSFV